MGLRSFITDPSTGVIATVKPAGEKPIISDASLVVSISPNQAAIPVTFAPTEAGSVTGIAFGKITLSSGTLGLLHAVRATPYTEQYTNAVRSVKSSSASDASSGVGMQRLLITYYDAVGAGPFYEDLALNGLTAVNTSSSNICFIESMRAAKVGTTGYNVGTVSMYTTTGGLGTVFASVGVGTYGTGVGDNRTLWAHHYVPTGFRASLSSIVVCIAGAAGSDGFFALKQKFPLDLSYPELIVSDISATPDSIERTLGSPIQVNGFCRITAYVVPDTNSTVVTAAFDYHEARQ